MALGVEASSGAWRWRGNFIPSLDCFVEFLHFVQDKPGNDEVCKEGITNDAKEYLVLPRGCSLWYTLLLCPHRLEA